NENENNYSIVSFRKDLDGPLLGGRINIGIPYWEDNNINGLKIEFKNIETSSIVHTIKLASANDIHDNCFLTEVNFLEKDSEDNLIFKDSGEYEVIVKFYSDESCITQVLNKEGIKRRVYIDRTPPTIDKKKFPISNVQGIHSEVFTVDDKKSGSGLYDPDNQESIERLLNPLVNSAFIYRVKNSAPTFPIKESELVNIDIIKDISIEEKHSPYMVSFKVQYVVNREEMDNNNCAPPGNPPRYYEYTYATDLAGNKTKQHPYYNDPTRSLRNTLFDKAISKTASGASWYSYEPSGGSGICRNPDNPDDIDLYSEDFENYETESRSVIESNNGVLEKDILNGDKVLLSSPDLVSRSTTKSTYVPYDYYNPTYEGYLKGYQSGILLSGTYPALDVMVTNLLNPTQLYYIPDWNPIEALELTKLIFVPSGALYGRGGDLEFKQKLDDFVSNGGILFVFSQQRGDDFTVLPGSPNGFGWSEDQSCYSFSAYVDSWNPMLSSIFYNPTTANFDGFFTEYPDDSKILLRRRSNSQPCMLMYPHGTGKVIVSSLYGDYAFGQYIGSIYDIRLIRDIISWAKKEDGRDKILEVGLESSYSIPVEIFNSGNTTATSIEFEFMTPEKTIVNRV
ncbi:hypothetical protein KAU33_16520, partial [Candidatus Dependentiae bacterium]|nr:hypothetical protein [Candidatus Dependentiae bacterium]